MIKSAEENRIPYQIDVAIAGGTNASTIHLKKDGIPTGEIIVARKYSHSPVEVASMDDIESAIKLLTQIVESMNPEFIASFEKKVK